VAGFKAAKLNVCRKLDVKKGTLSEHQKEMVLDAVLEAQRLAKIKAKLKGAVYGPAFLLPTPIYSRLNFRL
jgi:hypothetical protein